MRGGPSLKGISHQGKLSNMYQTIFLGNCFYCKNFGHKTKHCKAYRENHQDNIVNIKRKDQIRTYNSFAPLSKYSLECYKCDNLGHESQKCPLEPREKISRTNARESNFEKRILALCAQKNDNQWFVYSGCSRHITSDHKMFISLSTKKDGNVTFGDNGSSKIVGKGTMSLINGKGKAQNDLYVEGIKYNILSVNQICDQRHDLIFRS